MSDFPRETFKFVSLQGVHCWEARRGPNSWSVGQSGFHGTLVRVIVVCSSARHLAFTVLLSTKVYAWNSSESPMLGGTPR